MKLSLISESISSRDFFDFYVLQYAYNEHLPNHDDIAKYLKFIARKIMFDHLDQIGNIICNRYSPTKNIEKYANTMGKYYITHTENDISGFDELSIEEKQRYLKDLLPTIDKQDLGWFTGKTWRKLATWYAHVVIPHSIEGMVLLIDKIHNTFHHGGLITDYMEEFRWIEQALHTRNAGSPAQLLRYTSSDVRQLIGRSIVIGHKRGEVADLDKLHVALNKQRNKEIEISLKNGKLTVKGEFVELSYPKNYPKDDSEWDQNKSQEWTRFTVFPLDLPKTHKKNVARGFLKITKRGPFTVEIYEFKDKLSIHLHGGIIDVPKPIEMFTQLAQDIIQAGAIAAESGKPIQGFGIGSIKDDYKIHRPE